MGQLALPLLTQGASGVSYRLRNATFNIYRYGYGYPGAGGGSFGGSPGGGPLATVSSETNPEATTISVSVEEGSYYIELAPGWHFEKQTPSGYEEVEATLLYGQTQYVWVSRGTTSFARFQFGLGASEIWLNGELNIGVVLYEDPSELGYAGNSGTAGAGGGWMGGTAGGWPGGTGAVPLPAGGEAP